MSETLCVDGLDGDALIEEIRSVYGPDVEITSITGERRGGLFGFFAREYVSVTFEPPGEPLAAAPPADEPLAVAHPAVDQLADTQVAVAQPAPTEPAAPVSVQAPGRHAARPSAPDRPPAAPVLAPPAPFGPGELDALLARADRNDGPDRAPGPVDTELSFARLLAAFSAEQAGHVADATGDRSALGAQAAPAAARVSTLTQTDPVSAIQPAAWPASAPASVHSAWPPAAPGAARPAESDFYPASRARLDMLTQLGTIGVPVSMNPAPGVLSIHEAIEQLIDALPPAPVLPLRAGEILVLAGSVEQLAPAATVLAQQMHVAPEAIWFAGHAEAAPAFAGRSTANGFAGGAAAGRAARTISGPAEAAGRAIQLRAGSSPSIVAVELDQTAPGEIRFGWAPQVIAALQPTALWAAVDAGRKTADLCVELGLLGTIDALVVSGAARTASPATVWDLDIPIAIIDGRRATVGAWAGLLMDALRAAGRR